MDDIWDGDYYLKHGTAQMRASKKCIDRITLQDGAKVLDLGCGDGKVIAQLAKRFPKADFIGIDLSESMLKTANEHFGNLPNLHFEKQDITTFSFDERFNLITSFFALHWVEDQNAALMNVADHLAPGGEITFLLSSGKGEETLDPVFNSPKWIEAYGHFKSHYFPKMPDDYHQYIAETDLVEDHIIPLTTTHDFPHLDAAIAHVMTFAPGAFGLSHEKSLQLATDCAHALNKKPKLQLSLRSMIVKAHLPA